MTSFTVAVDPDGTSSPGGNQMTDNVPPPSLPVVEFPYQSEVIYRFNMPIYSRYYTNNPTRIDFTITSYAEGSDIVSFEYALGTSYGEADVVDWTQAVGVTVPVDINEGGVTRRISATIYNLQLEHNAEYYLSVRAYNSQGLFTQNNLPDRIIFDATPPSAPRFRIAMTPGGWLFPPASPVVYPQVARPPAWEPGKYSTPSAYTPPSRTISWIPGEDPESGLHGHEYILTSIADANAAFQNEANIQFTTGNSVTFSGASISYKDSLYFHVRTKNRAGSVSEQVLTIQPVIAIDPSRPSRPVVNARIFGNGLRLHIPKLSLDYESQTLGYQYSVGTAPGSSDVREWGSGIDFTQNFEVLIGPHPIFGLFPDFVPAEPDNVPIHVVPVSGFPQHTDLYINVRAVNGQGMTSGVAATGPFQLGTSPEEPDISISYNGYENRLNIQIGNIYDVGAPITFISYRILRHDTGAYTHSVPYAVPNVTGLYTQPGSRTVSQVVPFSGQGYKVFVTVRNSAGRETTVSANYFHSVTPPNFSDPIKLTW